MVEDLLSRISKARVNDNNLAEQKEREHQEYVLSLLQKLKDLTPRISKLIKTANALLENGYEEFLTPDEWGNNGWVSEGWAHHVGFMYDSWGDNKRHISSMGIVNGGACGSYDFHTTGETTYMTDWYKPEPVPVPLKESNAECFLSSFDGFEHSFYEAVEKFLESKSA